MRVNNSGMGATETVHSPLIRQLRLPSSHPSALILAAESGVTGGWDGSGAQPADAAQVMCCSLNY